MIALLAAGAAAAATLSLSERPADLTGPEGPKAYAEWLRGEALKIDAIVLAQPVCAKAAVSEATPATLEELPGPPNGGGGIVIHEHLIVAGCGHAWRVNVAVGRKAGGGGWDSQPMLPGNSRAGLVLQNDVLGKLLPAVAARNPGCKAPPAWAEVQVLAPPDGANASWVEEWKLSVCGSPIDLDITFTPSPDGGTDFSATGHRR